MRERIRQLLSDQRGNVLVLVAAAMVALLGFGAITIDAAAIYVARSQAQAAADAAALAGAQFLPGSPAMAQQQANLVAFQNNIDPMLVRVELSPDNTSITVGAGKRVNFGLAKVLGFNETQLSATATAKVGNLSAVYGIPPLVVLRQNYAPNQDYTLRSPDQVSPGNFRALNLDGGWNSGASNYSLMIQNGWSQQAYVGQQLDSEAGIMGQKTKDGIQYILDNYPADSDGDGIPDYQEDNNHDGYPDVPPTSRRLLTIPMVDSFPNGTSGTVTVTGFATFYLTGVSANGKEIYGRFIPGIERGEMSGSATDGGARVIKLVQ